MTEAAGVDWLELTAGLAGGLALFLFGLEQMTAALQAVAGNRMRGLLARLTVNRFAGVATGALTTAVIQSSSVTTVLVVSFISSGLMTLQQSVGIILGANIGTTVTAQIVAFKVTKLALVMIAGGFAVTFFTGRERLRQHGTGMLGLGLVFLGMTVMSESMAPLRDHAPFLEWMTRMQVPALGILAGAIFTALVQSSSATTGIVIAMASQGLLGLPAGIALILGANVGTCVTALLAALGKPPEALRAAAVHVLFNVLGALIWLPWIPELADVAARISPQAPEAANRLMAETPRQIANAHTLFNVTNALVFLPFVGLLATAVERLLPGGPRAAPPEGEPLYLDPKVLKTPNLALEEARLEIIRLGRQVRRMFADVLPAMLRGTRVALLAVRRRDEDVDCLHGHIIEYLGRVSRADLSGGESRELMHLMAVANAIEAVGDVIETDLVRQGLDRIESRLQVSSATRKLIEDFHDEVARALDDAIFAVEKRDAALAARVVEAKPQLQRMAADASEHYATRLVADERDRLATYVVETDMLEHLRRVFYFAKRIAHQVIAFEQPDAGGRGPGAKPASPPTAP